MNKTTEVEIEQFNNWVAERIAVLESSLESQKVPLDYRLTKKEPIHKDIFENCFKSAYIFINEEIEDTTWRAKEANIPKEVSDAAVKAFKELQAKVSKEKRKYKKAFKELQESINQSLEDEAYVQESETLVADTVKTWCGTHKIIYYMKDLFTGERLQKQIHHITMCVLTSRLRPNEDELKEMVERQMKHYTTA